MSIETVYLYFKYEIKYNGNCTLCLSDFEYTNDKNEKYQMIIRNKGNHGRWSIFKDENGKLFASDNVWFTGKDMKIEKFVIVEDYLSDEEKNEKYPNVQTFNSIDWVNEGSLKVFKEICDEAIEKNKAETFISKNTHNIFYMDMDDGNRGVRIRQKPKKVFEEDIIYELYVFDNYGDSTQNYDTEREAYDNAFKYFGYLIDGFIEDVDPNDKHFFDNLPMIEKKYMNEHILDYAKKNNYIFYKCKGIYKDVHNYIITPELYKTLTAVIKKRLVREKIC